MPTPRSPWEAAPLASSIPPTPVPTEGHDVQSDIGSGAPTSERSADMDQAGQDAIEGRDLPKPASRRRAIGIMFGIDPNNLYEAPGDAQSRDKAVRDLD